MGFIRDTMKIFNFKGLGLFLVFSKLIIIKKEFCFEWYLFKTIKSIICQK
jgi:hypothetical protein